jgi:glycosyltransferase involved in cell wall biosynthesis
MTRIHTVVWGGSLGARGGIETHILKWCKEVAHRGWPITLFYSGTDYAASRTQSLEAIGVECVDLGQGAPWAQAWRAVQAALPYRQRRVVFYSNGSGKRGPLIGRALRPRIWVHHYHVNYMAGAFRTWSYLERSAVLRSSITITCSPLHASRLSQDVPAANVTHLPYLKNEGPLVAPPHQDKPIVGYLGLLRAAKGVPLLLSMNDAFHTSGVRLVLWGRDTEGIFRNGVPASVDWRGEYDPESNLNEVLSEVSCLAVPSMEGEGLPIVISEALSRGIPVVTFPFSGVEWLRDLHPGLKVVEPTPAALISAVSELIALSHSSSFRSSLRSAYDRKLGNSLCLRWWENLLAQAAAS